MDEIKSYKEMMEKNHLCMMVLQNLVFDHNYMFEISHTERSQINSVFGTNIKEQIAISKTSKVMKD
jgi:hypothetical protein